MPAQGIENNARSVHGYSVSSEHGSHADNNAKIRAGIIGGAVGGVVIWIYEALVWVGAQHLMPLAGIPRNATGLVFGKAVQENLGFFSYVLGPESTSSSRHFGVSALH